MHNFAIFTILAIFYVGVKLHGLSLLNFLHLISGDEYLSKGLSATA